MILFMAFGGLVVTFSVSGVASDPSLNGNIIIVKVDPHHNMRSTT